MRIQSVYQVAAIRDDDALHTGIATGVAAVQATQADFNGALAAAFVAGTLPARTISLTTGADVGDWSTTEPIVVSGRYNNKNVSESLQPTAANGGETLYGTQPFDPGTMTIAVPAQPGVSTLKVGVSDICGSERRMICGVRAITAANVNVRSGGIDAVLAMAAKEIEEIPAERILGASTTAEVRVYFGTP